MSEALELHLSPIDPPSTDDTEGIRDSSFALKTAAEKGWNVVFPQENQLQVDLDDVPAYERFGRMLPRLRKTYGPLQAEVHWSKSGAPKRHATVTLGVNVTAHERIALQAILGSDTNRELFGLIRMRQGDAFPTLFYELLPIVET